MKPSNYIVLKHLDDPLRILSFTMQDIVSYALPFFIGAILDNLFLVPIIGLLFIYILKKSIRKFPRFFFIRFLYWNLPTKDLNRLLKMQLPPSHKRLWVR